LHPQPLTPGDATGSCKQWRAITQTSGKSTKNNSDAIRQVGRPSCPLVATGALQRD